MKAVIKTKSNFRDLNGKEIEVKEVVGTRVSCEIIDEIGRKITVDFGKSEVTLID